MNNFLKCSEEKIPIKNLLEYYNKLKSLTHSQDIYQIFIFILSVYLCQEEKFKNFDYSLNDLKNLVLNTNLTKNMVFIFEKKLNIYILPLIAKRNQTKFSVNFLEIINNRSDIFICKNIFTKEEIIFIKLNEENFKQQNIIFEQMKNRINNKINETKKIIIQFEKYIELKESNNSNLKEIYAPFLIEEDKKVIKNNSKIKLIDETKINKEMKELKEKIIELEKELKKEKDKNKLLENKIMDLEDKLNEEIKKIKI